MRRAWLPPMLLLSLLPGCGDGMPAASGPRPELQELAERAPGIGALMRAAPVCRVPVSMLAQDRAARIEAAAIEMHRQQGGLPARDAFLASLQPPGFDPRQRGRDRAAWCAARQAEIAHLDTTLRGPEGVALVERAEAARR